MVPSNLTIVCYTGGACGDLISAIIDGKDVAINNKAIKHTQQRQKLKKPHLFNSIDEKNKYLVDIALQYNSIPSHDLDYHISQSHNFISIVVDDIKTAKWAATRFKQLHRPNVWQEMARVSNINTVDEYAQLLIDYSSMVRNYTNRYVNLESIKSGIAVQQLEEILQFNISKAGQNIYSNWINSQLNL